MKTIITFCLCIFTLQTLAATNSIGKNVDILFVIDNSGSMQGIQQNLMNNAKTFFQEFAKQPYINWKIGIVSTDNSDSPYLGFDTSFDWSMIDYRDPTSFNKAVEEFSLAVSKLGLNGSADEFIFQNIKRSLNLYNGETLPRFLRPNSDLVVIMISDEPEQSQDRFGSEYEVNNFLKSMNLFKESHKNLRFYGALSLIDLPGCAPDVAHYKYIGSPYETIINLTNGFVVSACKDDFGAELAKIGNDIVSFVK